MPYTLTKRLLCAANQTYAISGPGPVPTWPGDVPPASVFAGYVKQPRAVQSDQHHEDAAFVARIPEGVLIAIRGTTPPKIGYPPAQIVADWGKDTNIVLGACAASEPFKGLMHPGFLDAFRQLRKAGLDGLIQTAVADHIAEHPSLPKKIFVTGHSKGGAICALVAWQMHHDYPQHEIVVRAFAPARVGNRAFATAYNAAVPDHIRYEYDADIIPHLPIVIAQLGGVFLPPYLAAILAAVDPGYAEVGTLAYIDTHGALLTAAHPPRPPGFLARITAIAGHLINPLEGPAYIADCHAIDQPANGYVRANYP